MKPHGPLAVGNTVHCVKTQHSMNHTHGMLLCSAAVRTVRAAHRPAAVHAPPCYTWRACCQHSVRAVSCCIAQPRLACCGIPDQLGGRTLTQQLASQTDPSGAARALTNQPFLHTCRQNAFSKPSGSQSIVPQCSAVQHDSNQHGCASQALNCTHT